MKKWIHLIHNKKLIGVGYCDVQEFKKMLPEIRKIVKKLKGI